MRRLVYMLIVALVAAACTATSLTSNSDTFATFDQHCLEHARDMTGEADLDSRYRECMALHGYYLIPESDTHLTGIH